MSYSFAEFLQCVPYVVDVKKPVLLRGRHGIGKSEVVYQFAKSINLPVVERRASQMTEGDLLGLPSIEGESTRWNPPDWFKMACDQPVVLFLDEIDRAILEVRQGIFELTDSRKMNGYTLHRDTLVFAAVNGGAHAAQYQVGEMDPAELDRYTVFDLEPTVEDWLNWAKDNVNGVIWDFINNNRAHLEHTTDFDAGKVYPSRRSWVRLNDCLSKGRLLDSVNKVSLRLSKAFVGVEAALAFYDFTKSYKRLVTVEDIIQNGKIELVKGWTLNEYDAFLEKLKATDLFSRKMTAVETQNYVNFWFQLPSEPSVKGIEILSAIVATMENNSSQGEIIQDNIVGIMKSYATVPVYRTGKMPTVNVSVRFAGIVSGQTTEEKELTAGVSNIPTNNISGETEKKKRGPKKKSQ